MSDTLFIPGDLDIRGSLKVRGTLPTIPRTNLEQDDFQPLELPLTMLRVWDAFATALGSPGNDDLGITAGTFATGAPYVTAGDLKAAGATTRRARCLIALPYNYVAGQSVRIVLTAGMLTTIADTSCTVDVEAYKLDGDTTIGGSDVVSTAAQSINSLTFADLNFDLTPTTLDAGTMLDVRISVTCTDAATGTAVTPAIAAARIEFDLKG
jgi:hypothetical protein